MARKPRKKTAPLLRDPVTVWDVNACAPEFFSVAADASEWTRRVTAFVEAMHDISRAVLVNFDPETGKLSLSSIPEVPNVG